MATTVTIADNGAYHALEENNPLSRQVGSSNKERRKKERRSLTGSSFIFQSEKVHGSATVGAAMTNTAKSVFGSGVLAMPHAFAATGMVPGFILTLAIGAWSFFTASLIARCTRLVPGVATFDELAEAAFGRCGQWIGAVNLVLHQIFVCCAYLVFVAQNIAAVAGIGTENAPYPFWMVLMLLPPFLILVCLRDMSSLSGVSALGNLFVVASLVIILVVAAPEMSMAEWVAPVHFTVSGMAKFFGIAAFTFAGQTEVVPIFLSMATPSKYSTVVLPVVGVAALVSYAAVGSLVFCAYRENTPANVFTAMNGTSGAIVKLTMSAVIYLTLPLKLFPAVQVFEAALSINDVDDAGDEGKSVGNTGGAPAAPSRFVNSRYRIATRVGLATLPAAIAMVLTDFGFLVEFVGAFCLGIVAFTMPPMMYIALNPKMSKVSKLFFVVLSVMGIGVTAFTTTKVVLEKFKIEL